MNMITTYWAKRRARIKRAKLVKDIEGSRLRLVKTMNDLRIWIGLPLVQGSSVLALFNKPMLFYWITLEVGLFVYLITSIGLYFEARRTAKETKVKFDNRLGSTKAAVKATAEKRRSEIAYIVGNFMGLVFVGSNIYRALIA